MFAKIAVKCVQPPSFNFLTEYSKVCSICSGRLYAPINVKPARGGGGGGREAAHRAGI